MEIVTILAHPDDETLGCGGSIAKWVSNGHQVYCLIPGLGMTSRKFGKKNDVKKLREDCQRALAILGVKKLIFGDFDDNEMDKYSRLKLFQWVENNMPITPDLVITHHWRCTNIDHRYCYEAAIIVTRASLQNRIDLLCAEIPSSTGSMRPTWFEASHYEILNKGNIKAKLQALKEYESEIAPYPHPRSLKHITALARIRGVECGAHFAEAFQTIRRYHY
jgi:LmbE family N-acetylglucosaminyl deacetylase